MHYQIVTYGCQMNVHESEKLAEILEREGYLPTEDREEADIIVFNTCCIRENAEKRVFGNVGAIKNLKKKKPELLIAVCGCMPQQNGMAEKLTARFPFIDIVFGTYNIDEFASMIGKRKQNGKRVVEIWPQEEGIREDIGYRRDSSIHAYVNIMYGCNNFCTYCIVPYVRGRERSRSMSAIRSEVETLISQGYREITLLGQNVNSYGSDLHDGTDFVKLLKNLCEIKGDFRIRFMTSHPKDLTEEVVRTIASQDKLCHSIHLPIQSGSDRVLQRMNRRYTAEHYLGLIDLIRRFIADCAITTDLMVGFPGESDIDFEETLALVRRVRFDNAFTFVYSVRNGTKAAGFADQIEESVKKERIIRLVKLQNQITAEISRAQIGKTFEVLIDGHDNKFPERLSGRTDCGRLVSLLPAENLSVGDFVKVHIVKANASSLTGETIH